MIELLTENPKYENDAEVIIEYNSPKYSHFDFCIVSDLEGMTKAQNILLEANRSRNIANIDFPPASKLYEKHCITFIIEEDCIPVATFSLIIDSNNGLPADKTFSSELTQYRNRSSNKISEICSLGVIKSCQRKKEIALYIVALSTLQTIKLSVSECFITVKDKHVSFYKALNFEESSEKRISQRTSARVQLLSIKKEHAEIPVVQLDNKNSFASRPVKNLWSMLNRAVPNASVYNILHRLKSYDFFNKSI